MRRNLCEIWAAANRVVTNRGLRVSGRPSRKSAEIGLFCPFLPFSGGPKQHLVNPENGGKRPFSYLLNPHLGHSKKFLAAISPHFPGTRRKMFAETSISLHGFANLLRLTGRPKISPKFRSGGLWA